MKSCVCKKCGSSFEVINSKRGIYCSKSCTAGMNKTHGHSYNRTPEYVAWWDMRNRCRNPNAKNYIWYGARGITVCERWQSFENFLGDMGLRPEKGLSIDRINNDGNYEPGNCRWATRSQQNSNRRRSRGPQTHTAVKCSECDQDLADLPSKLCPGCQAYREHQR